MSVLVEKQQALAHTPHMDTSISMDQPRAITLTKVIMGAMDEWALKMSEGKIVRVTNPSIRAFTIKDMLMSVGVECHVQRMERSAIFVGKTKEKEYPQTDGLYVFSVRGGAQWDEDGDLNWGDSSRAIARSFMRDRRKLKSLGDWAETELSGMFAGNPSMEDIDQDLWEGMRAYISAALHAYVLNETVNHPHENAAARGSRL